MGEEQEIEYKESFDSGKYTAIFYKKGGLIALRYGEPWRDLAGDNLFYWMLVEVARLREENRQLKGGPDKGQWISTEEGWLPYNRWMTLAEFYRAPQEGLYQWKAQNGHRELCIYTKGQPLRFIDNEWRDRRFDVPLLMQIHLPE